LRARLIAYKDGAAGVRIGCSVRIGNEKEIRRAAGGTACLDFVNSNGWSRPAIISCLWA
jgi:hypothetical protein